MVERLILAAAVILTVYGIGRAIRKVVLKHFLSCKIDSIKRSSESAQQPLLLYFYTGTCTQCKPQLRNVEEAALLLKQAGITLHIQKYNALESPELAQKLHVLTVPTTVIVDADNNVRAWNAGLTDTLQLVHQYRDSFVLCG